MFGHRVEDAPEIEIFIEGLRADIRSDSDRTCYDPISDFEELVAELGAAFLCSEFELEDVPRKNDAQYLNSWLQILKEKPAVLWLASTLGQSAVKFLIELKI